MQGFSGPIPGPNDTWIGRPESIAGIWSLFPLPLSIAILYGMADQPPRYQQLFAELKRRRVFRVLTLDILKQKVKYLESL